VARRDPARRHHGPDVVVIVDMLAGVFLRYVMTWISARSTCRRSVLLVEESASGAGLAHVHRRRRRHPARDPLRRASLHRAVSAALRRRSRRHACLMVAFGALVAVYGWQVAELNSQSFSPALVLNCAGSTSRRSRRRLMVVYGLIALLTSWRPGHWGQLRAAG
jgi:hypothetical protein